MTKDTDRRGRVVSCLQLVVPAKAQLVRVHVYALLREILTPSSEPDLSLLAKAAFGAAGALGVLGAPGPLGGAWVGGGLEGPVSELREPLAPPILVAPLGGGD